MEKDEAIKKLQEFNKAANEILSLSFIQKFHGSGFIAQTEEGAGFQFIRTMKGGAPIRLRREKGYLCKIRGPDDEAIKAFCNDLRKFIQKNDSLSINNLTPIYQSDLVLAGGRDRFNEIISDYEKFMKQQKHEVNDEKLTNQRIFDVFLYGNVSHRSNGTKEIHDSWESNPGTYLFLKNEFISILYNYVEYIYSIIYVNGILLEILSR